MARGREIQLKLTRLTLKHFRNYADLTLDCAPGLNLILGKNGQGKTNLLEAIYFLSNTKSNRTASDRELLCHNNSQSLIVADIRPPHFDGQMTVAANLAIGSVSSSETGRLKTTFKINTAPVKSRSEVLGYIPSVGIFSFRSPTPARHAGRPPQMARRRRHPIRQTPPRLRERIPPHPPAKKPPAQRRSTKYFPRAFGYMERPTRPIRRQADGVAHAILVARRAPRHGPLRRTLRRTGNPLRVL